MHQYSLIDLEQTGFMKNRQTQDNVWWALQLIDYVGNNKKESEVISHDAEMAFD